MARCSGTWPGWLCTDRLDSGSFLRQSPASRTEGRVTPIEISSDSKSGNRVEKMEAVLKTPEIDIKTLLQAWQRGSEQNSKERQVTDIRDLAESETHLRAHLPSGDRRRGLGPLDDEGRSRIVVGPRGIRDESQQARTPPGWQVRIRDDGDRFGPNGRTQGGRSPSHDRRGRHLCRGHTAYAPRVQDGRRFHPWRGSV